jgi:hypothetical protein
MLSEELPESLLYIIGDVTRHSLAARFNGDAEGPVHQSARRTFLEVCLDEPALMFADLSVQIFGKPRAEILAPFQCGHETP